MDNVLHTDREIPLSFFYESYLQCRKHKRMKQSALEFELDFPRRVYELYEEVNEGRYEVGQSICFLVRYPVLREVFAASFRDRIVHHVVINRIGDMIESELIDDSYACRRGKGVLYGVRRLQEKARKAFEEIREPYVTKGDIKSFFRSIDKERLWAMLRNLITEKYKGKDKDVILYLTEKIVTNCPQDNCEIRGGREAWKHLAREKSLFTCARNKGLPIGNLTSQIFANLYMTAFDKAMTARYGLYGRYVDDYYVIGTREACREVAVFAEVWLKGNLGLETNKKKAYMQPLRNGVKFTGWVVKRSRLYVGSKIAGRAFLKTEAMNRDKNTTVAEACVSLNSYLGCMAHGRSYGIRRDVVASLEGRLLADIIPRNEYRSVASREIEAKREERRRIEWYARKRKRYYRARRLARQQKY